MNTDRQLATIILLQMIFDKTIFKTLLDIGIVKRDSSYFTDELAAKIEKVIHNGAFTKEYIASHIDKWIDDAVEESIYNNEKYWKSFGLDLDDIEMIVDEDNIVEKAKTKATTFIYNI